MKKQITISMPDDQVDALACFLHKKDTTIEKEVEYAMTRLYEKHVPPTVRDFLETKAQLEGQQPSGQVSRLFGASVGRFQTDVGQGGVSERKAGERAGVAQAPPALSHRPATPVVSRAFRILKTQKPKGVRVGGFGAARGCKPDKRPCRAIFIGVAVERGGFAWDYPKTRESLRCGFTPRL